MSDDDQDYNDRPTSSRKRSKSSVSPEEIALKKEMHRRCESRRRERINQSYDMLFDLLRNTSTVKLKQEDKIDRCTLMRLTHGYMKELKQSVNETARVLCKLASNDPKLLELFPSSYLQFILQSEYVDDDVCLLLASCYNMPYQSKSMDKYIPS